MDRIDAHKPISLLKDISYFKLVELRDDIDALNREHAPGNKKPYLPHWRHAANAARMFNEKDLANSGPELSETQVNALKILAALYKEADTEKRRFSRTFETENGTPPLVLKLSETLDGNFAMQLRQASHAAADVLKTTARTSIYKPNINLADEPAILKFKKPSSHEPSR